MVGEEMKNMRKRLLAFLLCCIIASGIGWCPPRARAEAESEKIWEPFRSGSGEGQDFRQVGKSGDIELYFNKKNGLIAVADKSNEFVWGSPCAVGLPEDAKYPKKIMENMQALFNFSYSNLKNNKGQVIETNSVSEDSKVDCVDRKNGISLTYDFRKLGISLSVDIMVKHGSLVFYVPADKIREDGEWGLVSIEALPFFGASRIGQDGYLFYPDGSGALLYFDQKPRDISKYSFNVYGTDQMDFRELEKEDDVMLPVFGIRQENNAFLAILSQGDTDARMNLYPSGYVTDWNRISPEFVYRRLYKDPRSDEKILYKIEDHLIKTDREVQYLFLSGEEADYSGMANCYRDYLIHNKKLADQPDDKDAAEQIPVGLDFFMGITEDRILFDRFIPATTYEQVQRILDQMLQEGITSMDTHLIGWQKGGYGSYHLPPKPDRHLGGKKGLENLSEYASDRNIRLYLQANLADITGRCRGYTPRRDTLYQANGMVVTDADQNRYLVNPFAAQNKLMKNFLPHIKKYAINGLNFDVLGSQLYYDYNKDHPVTREQTAACWQAMLGEAKQQYGSVAVQGGNQYVLDQASRLYRIPTEGNGLFITSESIPFFQMVVHGSLSYTSAQPGNLAYDFPREKLKWVEYGFLPYFELTYQKSNVLKNTDYNKLFSSYYGDWEDTILEVFREFNDRLGGIWHQTMIRHEKIMKDVFKVTYEDGSQIYVNYRDEAVQVDGRKIPKLDYLVVGKEADKR